MFFVSGALAIVVIAGVIEFWRNLGKIGARVSIFSGFFLSGLSIFWMNQMELVNIVKWNFTGTDILLVAKTLVFSSLVWIMILKLVRFKKARANIEKIASLSKLLPILLTVFTLTDLMVLFSLIVPSLYHQSVLSLIWAR